MNLLANHRVLLCPCDKLIKLSNFSRQVIGLTNELYNNSILFQIQHVNYGNYWQNMLII